MATFTTNAIINGVSGSKGLQASVSIFRASDENGKAKGFVSGLLNLKKENRERTITQLESLEGQVAEIEIFNPDFVIGETYETKEGETKQDVNCYGLLSYVKLTIS